MRVIVRGLPTPPRRHLMLVPATDQVLASSAMIYLPRHHNTAHLPPGMDRLPVANTTAASFSIRPLTRLASSGVHTGRCYQGGGKRRSVFFAASVFH